MLLKYFHLSRAYTPHGWQNDIYVAVDDAGEIIYCDTKPEESVDYEFVKDNVIPGFINLHSHAFQYAFDGMTELLTDSVAHGINEGPIETGRTEFRAFLDVMPILHGAC